MLTCVSGTDTREVLGLVISYFIPGRMEELLWNIDNRSGWSWQGLLDERGLGYTYRDNEYPEDDDPPPGIVRLSAFGDEEFVTEEFFERFTIEAFLACLEAHKQAGVDGGHQERLRLELLMRRDSLPGR